MCTYLDQVGSTYYFRRVVPLELRPYILTRTGAPRTEWKISLGTKDREEAKRLLPEHTLRTNAEIDDAKDELAAAGSGVAGESRSKSPGVQSAMYARLANERALRREARNRQRAEMEETASKFSTAELDPVHAIIKDIMEERREAASQAPAQADAVPLLKAFDAYAMEQAIKPTTRYEWRQNLKALVKFLGHDDAARITVDDLDRWREALLSETTKRGTLRTARTVKDKYFAALRATLNWVVEKRKLKENVATKVVVRVPRKAKLRDRDFTAVEARTILRATLMASESNVTPKTALARRWIPWLCAYTGARVNEISQLRGKDVTQIEGIWAVRITPEAGTVKANSARLVPLHPHLIEQGFPAVAKAAGDSPIFYDPSTTRRPGQGNRHFKKVGERLRDWVRDEVKITDPAIQPNHAWRHTFKTMTRAAEIPERVADAIQGHAPKSVGQSYGSVPLKTLADAIGKLPRFETEQGPSNSSGEAA